MVALLKIAIRFIIYVVILFPLVSGIFGGEIIGNIIGFIVVALVASILEIRGIMRTLINSIFGFAGGVMKKSDNALSETLGSTIAPDEAIAECPNCGSQITLKNSRGRCDGCGTEL